MHFCPRAQWRWLIRATTHWLWLATSQTCATVVRSQAGDEGALNGVCLTKFLWFWSVTRIIYNKTFIKLHQRMLIRCKLTGWTEYGELLFRFNFFFILQSPRQQHRTLVCLTLLESIVERNKTENKCSLLRWVAHHDAHAEACPRRFQTDHAVRCATRLPVEIIEGNPYSIHSLSLMMIFILPPTLSNGLDPRLQPFECYEETRIAIELRLTSRSINYPGSLSVFFVYFNEKLTWDSCNWTVCSLCFSLIDFEKICFKKALIGRRNNGLCFRDFKRRVTFSGVFFRGAWGGPTPQIRT